MSSRTSSFSLLFYVSKTKVQKSGEAPLLLKINVNGRRLVINLKQSVNPNDWDTGKGRVAGRTDQAKLLNNFIDAVRYKVRQKYNELIQLNDEITPEMLRDAILGINNSAVRTIVAVWEDHLEGMRKLIGKETTRATCQKYNPCRMAHHQAKHGRPYLPHKVYRAKLKEMNGTKMSLFED